MPFYKFNQDDLFYNRIKTYPSVIFHISNRTVVYNNDTQITGAFSTNVKNVPSGYISLYELNVDRASDNFIYPFVTKEGSLTSFKTITTDKFNSDFGVGDEMSGSYPLSASISSDRYAVNVSGSAVGYHRDALQNNLNRYTKLSPHFAYSGSLGNKDKQEIRIISIPSIFYGSSIKRGSVSLKFFVSGALISELQDNKGRGELKQVSSGSGADSGSVAGVVMYNEGFIILTGSWNLTASTFTENYGPGNATPRWIDFGFTGSSDSSAPSSSFQMSFSGTNYIPTLTMMTHMPKGKLNYSNNPTFLKAGQTASLTPTTGAFTYRENTEVSIKSVAKTNFEDPTGSFEKVTYINRVGIYDKYRNLIGIAKLATPVRKREIDDFTLKLKLDF